MAKTHNGGGRTPVSVGVRSGPASTNKISPSGVSEIGASQYQNPSPLNVGKAAQPKQGNEVAASTVCGPGGSRTTTKAGSQGNH